MPETARRSRIDRLGKSGDTGPKGLYPADSRPGMRGDGIERLGLFFVRRLLPTVLPQEQETNGLLPVGKWADQEAVPEPPLREAGGRRHNGQTAARRFA